MSRLMLDVDTQTDVQSVNRPTVKAPVDDQMSRMHINMISRINELEIQNEELAESVHEIRAILVEFKRMWEMKINNEKDTDVLLRNIGLIS
jgi:proteasome assembly chaperone (PAC2) family protein